MLGLLSDGGIETMLVVFWIFGAVLVFRLPYKFRISGHGVNHGS